MKTCPQCRTGFEVSDQDQQLLKELSPVVSGQTFNLPEPTLCPSCRFQRRLAFRNERHLYHRKSDFSGKVIVSTYAPESPFKVLDQDEWWSDRWDALDYGRDVDFSRSFFDQLEELNRAVPHMSLYTRNVENSYYTNYTLNLKDCYLVFGCTNSENCLFGQFISQSKDVVDSLSLYSCERVYEGIASKNVYHCRFFTNCFNCSDSLMIEDCADCRHCMLCFGLKNKEYCFLNEFVGQEKYEQILSELGDLTWEKIGLLKAKLEDLKKKLPRCASHLVACEDSTGDMLSNCRDCSHCFDMTESEHCRYCSFFPRGVSSMDCTFGAPFGQRFCYETCSCPGSQRSVGCFLCWNCDAAFYSMECQNSRDIFGCIGLKNKQYCILNRQYTKAEYESLVPRLIKHMQRAGEWGQYMPIRLSSFAYNETIAHEHFPLTKEVVLAHEWKWREKTEIPSYKGPSAPVPESVAEVSDELCEKILLCEATGKPYRIIPQELKFYRENGLPVPKICPDERHRQRLARRQPNRLWSRLCAKCATPIQTTYAPDRPEIVYCENCYLKNIY